MVVVVVVSCLLLFVVEVSVYSLLVFILLVRRETHTHPLLVNMTLIVLLE